MLWIMISISTRYSNLKPTRWNCFCRLVIVKRFVHLQFLKHYLFKSLTMSQRKKSGCTVSHFVRARWASACSDPVRALQMRAPSTGEEILKSAYTVNLCTVSLDILRDAAKCSRGECAHRKPVHAPDVHIGVLYIIFECGERDCAQSTITSQKIV
jgi:hypothetical protein